MFGHAFNKLPVANLSRLDAVGLSSIGTSIR